MKTIQIKFCDFSKGFNEIDNDFVRILQKRYDVRFSDTPEYVFYSVFGHEHMKYDAIRIFYTGECFSPDFNITDYAMGFDRISFDDRYLRVPLYRLFQYRQALIAAGGPKQPENEQRDFCSFVCSNDRGMSQRDQMFDLLNSYRPVASGGRYRNNVGGAVADKNAFLKQYRFNLAFENCSAAGYTTEKIVEAFAAGAIPIYYGNPDIAEEFNPDAFINCHDYPTLEDALREVIRINEDEALYAAMKNAPVFVDRYTDQSDIEAFLYHIFDQPVQDARRRPSNALTAEWEKQNKGLHTANTLLYKPMRRVRNLFSRIKHKSL